MKRLLIIASLLLITGCTSRHYSMTDAQLMYSWDYYNRIWDKYEAQQNYNTQQYYNRQNAINLHYDQQRQDLYNSEPFIK